jgi:hypothetical protein
MSKFDDQALCLGGTFEVISALTFSRNDRNLPRLPAPKYQYILDDRVFRDVLNLSPGGCYALNHIICNAQEGNCLITFPAAVSASRLLSRAYCKLHCSKHMFL